MLPRRQESEDCGAERTTQKPENKAKAINIPIWPLNSGLTDKHKCFNPPCACHLCGLVAFLLLSIITLSLATSYPEPSEKLHSLLGNAPPALYLNIALAIYIISEFFYILLRSGQDGSRKFALKQLGFYSGFYFFFWYAGMLQQHFMLLAISGIILQTMESFSRAQSYKRRNAETE